MLLVIILLMVVIILILTLGPVVVGTITLAGTLLGSTLIGMALLVGAAAMVVVFLLNLFWVVWWVLDPKAAMAMYRRERDRPTL